MARRPNIAPIRDRASLNRRAGRQAPRQAMLIVCEGETEKFYFDALREAHQLTQAEIVIPAGATGNDPLNLVKYAERYQREKGPYDYIYCVFDRDTHGSFGAARLRIRELATRARSPLPIFEAVSIPCFEIWVIQHFQRSDRPFQNSAEAIAYIKDGLIPAYAKADIAIARNLISQVGAAIDNAAWLVERNTATATDNPSTNLHELATKIAEMAGA